MSWCLGRGLGRREESLVDGEAGRGHTGWITPSQASLPQDWQIPRCSPLHWAWVKPCRGGSSWCRKWPFFWKSAVHGGNTVNPDTLTLPDHGPELMAGSGRVDCVQ